MTTQKTNGKAPSHYIYAVIDRPGSDKGYWNRIGAAFENGDGKGWNLRIDLWPTGKANIVMREPKEEETSK